MNSDVKLAIETITKKQAGYTRLFGMYDGDQPIVYSKEVLRTIFHELNETIRDNVCAVVIDATKERLALKGFTTGDDTVDKAIAKWMVDQDVINEADEIHEAALVTPESFAIVWPKVAEGKSTGQAEMFYNDPRNCHIFYKGANPKEKRMAAKLWQEEEDGRFHLTLYYADRLEYYVTAKKPEDNKNLEDKMFVPDVKRPGVKVNGEVVTWPLNPYKRIPVFHFRVSKRGQKSDITNVVPLQMAANKLFADMMIASEFSSLKQRYIISNADVQGLKNMPNGIWSIPAGAPGEQETQVGEFSGNDLGNFMNTIKEIVNQVSIITNTPRHYFEQSQEAPSGEALIAMEAPLNKKVKDRIDKFTPVWREIILFVLEIMSISLPEGKEVTPNWEKPETVQPRTEWEIAQIQSAMIPLEIILEWQGKSPAEIKRIMKAVEEKKKQEDTRLADAYAEAARRNATNGAGGGQDENPPQSPFTKGDGSSGGTAADDGSGNNATPSPDLSPSGRGSGSAGGGK